MPNWCFTTIIFHGNKDEIEKLHWNINEWTMQNLKPNGFGRWWLGNILCGAGLGDRIDSEENRIRCRGVIEYIGEVEQDDELTATLSIQTETAWAPMVKMWDEVFEVMGYESIDYSFQSEEEGMSEYFIHDPFGDFVDRYYIDIYLEGKDFHDPKLNKVRMYPYISNQSHMIEFMQEILDTDETDYDILLEGIKNYPFKDENSYINIHEHKWVEKEDCY